MPTQAHHKHPTLRRVILLILLCSFLVRGLLRGHRDSEMETRNVLWGLGIRKKEGHDSKRRRAFAIGSLLTGNLASTLEAWGNGQVQWVRGRARNRPRAAHPSLTSHPWARAARLHAPHPHVTAKSTNPGAWISSQKWTQRGKERN